MAILYAGSTWSSAFIALHARATPKLRHRQENSEPLGPRRTEGGLLRLETVAEALETVVLRLWHAREGARDC
eukprot:scaffold75144_cov34-Phaeocystis_antarctica.AAC.1